MKTDVEHFMTTEEFWPFWKDEPDSFDMLWFPIFAIGHLEMGSPRSAKIVSLRAGLDDGKRKTFKQVAAATENSVDQKRCVSGGRIAQIYWKARRRLRHPEFMLFYREMKFRMKHPEHFIS